MRQDVVVFVVSKVRQLAHIFNLLFDVFQLLMTVQWSSKFALGALDDDLVPKRRGHDVNLLVISVLDEFSLTLLNYIAIRIDHFFLNNCLG
jgi:hypothetical protein